MRWWVSIVSQEMRKILAYRSDFWVTFIGQTLLQLIIARALWQSIFEAQNVTELNGFDLESLTLYYIIAPIGTKILLGETFGFISREIYEGTFTKYLLYPLSFVQYKSLTYLTNSVFYAFQLILITTLYSLFFKAHFSFINLLSGAGLFLIAAYVYLNLSMAMELISLWADNVWSLMIMLRFFTAFLGGGLIPLDFYPTWALKVVSFTPFPYLISLPVRTVMGSTTGSEVFQGILILGVWWVIFRSLVFILWKVGQKRYTGVGQ